MSGGDYDQGPDRPGVRRRHSSHHDDDALEPAAYAVDRAGRRVFSEPGLQPASTSSGVDSSDFAAIPTRSASNAAPRVRFSVDVDRSTIARSPTAASRTGGASRPLARSGTPNLSLDTQSANEGLRPSVLGQTIVRSPVESPPSASPRHANKLSPLSPNTRARGYSLRSSLFRKNIQHFGTETEDGVIELQDAGSSSQPSLVEQPEQSPVKKSTDGTSITVRPSAELPPRNYPDLEDMPSGTENKGALPGIAALPHYESWIAAKSRHNGLVKQIGKKIEKARKFVLRINEIPPSKDGRHIDLDASRKMALTDDRTGKPYVPNTIRSSRYNVWNFLPRQLFAQFSKLANFYFLCVSILQMIPGLSTTGTYTTIIPLAFFISLSMFKEGYDDFCRYRLDKAENNRETTVLHAYQPIVNKEAADEEQPTSQPGGPIHWAPMKWKDIRVGDVVKLKRDDAAPADLVLLHSTGANGVAHIETMALDGETNLKSKQASAALAKACKNDEYLSACRAHFVVEDPNLDLYNFEGRVTYDGETAPLTNAEIVYRGSILRNTPEAVGMVIYTGEECKIRMNANKNPRIKAPALQSLVNKIVLIIVVFVIALAIFNTVAYQIWSSKNEGDAWYLTNAGVAFFPILTSFIIMFNTMIPLSLYVSLEIVKVWQMWLLNDIDMYHAESNTPFEAHTSTINEELGQISYIFSDKTGTLTDNSMKFRKMSIAGTAWLHNHDLGPGDINPRPTRPKKKNKGKKPLRKSLASVKQAMKNGAETVENMNEEGSSDALVPHRESSQWTSSARPGRVQPELLTTSDLIQYIQRKPYTVFARKTRLFLLSIALCHTCLPEEQKDGTIDFQASSPDELALVRAAQELGYMVINRDINTITLKSRTTTNGEPVTETYEVLDVIEFSSKRKRMSAIVRFPDNRICVLCKGADSIIMQRLKHAQIANQKVVEIERRASKRKSMEAQVAIARKSEQVERTRNSTGRPSFSMGRTSVGGLGRASIGGTGRASMGGLSRTSVGGLGRPSMSGNKLQPVRDELNNWLTERERDVDVSSMEENSIYYSPRPSAQIGRASMAVSEARSSMQLDDDEEDLVEESLVVDEPTVIERCFQHINDFATEGLRTLLYGYRFIDEQEYQGWKKIYLDATTSLVDRQIMIEQAGELIEQNLDLAGATAIEDKLQNGVPQAIDKLRRANIKMWMLTGDKRETAINIGQSCRLIKDYSSVTILDHESGEVEQHIASAIVSITSGNVAHSVMVVDGQTLSMISEDRSLHSLFFDLAVLVDSVICCRASPSQKASLVSMVRKKVKKSITLAIGDGANDIAMIQEAHVGIGITGKEGLQAARASDYSIAQFRFLTKLLLVHGRWNYIRTCKYTVATFWKEFVFYLTQALFQRLAGYTGTSLYESWSLSMFNTLFTSLPVIILGIFEQDLAPSTLLAVPELYTKGQLSGGFNFKVYLGWIFMGSSEAMVVFFCMLGLYGQALFTEDQGLFAMGDLTFTAIVVLISVKLQLLEMHTKTYTALFSFVLSVGGWFLWNIILAATYSNNMIYNVKDGFFDRFGRNASWWLTLIMILASVIVFELGVSSLRATFFTTDVDAFQELEKDPQIRRRFEDASVDELQQGWLLRGEKDGKDKRASLGDAPVLTAQEQAEREGEVRDLLRNRPANLEEGRASGSADAARAKPRNSLEIQEMLSRGFGSVRR